MADENADAVGDGDGFEVILPSGGEPADNARGVIPNSRVDGEKENNTSASGSTAQEGESPAGQRERSQRPRREPRKDKARYKVSEANRRVREANRRNEELQRTVEDLKGKVDNLQIQTGVSDLQQRKSAALAPVHRKLVQAQRAEREARENGDLDAEFNARNAYVAALREKDGLEHQFNTVIDQANDVLENGAQGHQQQRVDPVQKERFDTWSEDNPWFKTDREMTDRAMELHKEFIEDGIQAGSPLYYRQIDEVMREEFPDRFSADATGETRSMRRSAPMGGTNKVDGDQHTDVERTKDGHKVTLNRDAVAAAKKMGVPLEDYARGYLDGKEKGYY